MISDFRNVGRFEIELFISRAWVNERTLFGSTAGADSGSRKAESGVITISDLLSEWPL